MPAAVAIPAIIGAAGVGTQIAGAKMASNASKRAADQQVAATREAQAFNQRAYDDQQRALSPYLQAGQQSLGSLMSQYSGQPLQNPFAPQGMNAQGQPQYGPMQGPQGMPGPKPGLGMKAGGVGGMSLGAAMGGAQAPQGGGGMVRVQAPTGEMAMLPAGSPQLQMALAKGAKELQ